MQNADVAEAKIVWMRFQIALVDYEALQHYCAERAQTVASAVPRMIEQYAARILAEEAVLGVEWDSIELPWQQHSTGIRLNETQSNILKMLAGKCDVKKSVMLREIINSTVRAF